MRNPKLRLPYPKLALSGVEGRFSKGRYPLMSEELVRAINEEEFRGQTRRILMTEKGGVRIFAMSMVSARNNRNQRAVVDKLPAH